MKEAFRKRQITWERAIGMQMERQIEGVKNSDRIHMTSVYQDYLRRALETQKDELYQTNRFLSDVDINSKRNLFVDKLSEGIFALQKETSEYEIDPVEEQVVEIVEEPEPDKLRSDSLVDLKDVYSQQKNKWEKGYQQSYQKGLREFSTALQSIQSGYDSFTKNLDEKDKEFQSHLKAINDYKKVVTKAIEGTVNNLSDMLYYSDNKDLFRKKNSSEYNLAGQKLSDLISRMRSRLFAKDEDYSTLLTNLS
ncbi:MAG: TIGR04388 family protein, partial [Spirochaetota bacterium]